LSERPRPEKPDEKNPMCRPLVAPVWWTFSPSVSAMLLAVRFAVERFR
jgi:hypothetical protein